MANIEIHTWYWLICGIVLVLGEIFIPSGIFVWVGAGACVVGVISILLKLSLVFKLAIWAAVASLLIIIWFRFFRDNDSTRAGRAEATLGYCGVLMRPVAPKIHSELRFPRPILGEEVWPCESEHSINAHQRVKVVAVVGREGKRLRVTAA